MLDRCSRSCRRSSRTWPGRHPEAAQPASRLRLHGPGFDFEVPAVPMSGHTRAVRSPGRIGGIRRHLQGPRAVPSVRRATRGPPCRPPARCRSQAQWTAARSPLAGARRAIPSLGRRPRSCSPRCPPAGPMPEVPSAPRSPRSLSTGSTRVVRPDWPRLRGRARTPRRRASRGSRPRVVDFAQPQHPRAVIAIGVRPSCVLKVVPVWLEHVVAYLPSLPPGVVGLRAVVTAAAFVAPKPRTVTPPPQAFVGPRTRSSRSAVARASDAAS
jgi:hypothetical protein